MKLTQILLLTGIIFVLSSCFIADDLYGEKGKPKLSLKQKTQAAIASYVKDNIDDEVYYKYGFSELIIHKPKELILLGNLKKDRDNKNIDQDSLELQILSVEKKIEVNQLSYKLEMDHVFSLTSSKKGSTDLIESRFFLSDKLEVTEVKALMMLPVNEVEETSFANYFFENVIFKKEDYYQSKKLSKGFYSHFKQHQQELIGVKVKSDFLKHTLMMCYEVERIGDFRQDLVLQKITMDYIKEKMTSDKVQAIEFSTLFEINENETLKGYYFFHKFSDYKNETKDTTVAYVGFSPYYELVDYAEVEKPFNQYFNE